MTNSCQLRATISKSTSIWTTGYKPHHNENFKLTWVHDEANNFWAEISPGHCIPAIGEPSLMDQAAFDKATDKLDGEEAAEAAKSTKGDKAQAVLSTDFQDIASEPPASTNSSQEARAQSELLRAVLLEAITLHREVEEEGKGYQGRAFGYQTGLLGFASCDTWTT